MASLAVAFVASCTPLRNPDSSEDGDDDPSGSGGAAGSEEGAGGAAGSAGVAGAAGSAGTGSMGGAGGTGGAGGAAGTGGSGGSSGGTSAGPVLPGGTLLYVRSRTKDSDVLVARDLSSNQERVVTDLTGDGSSGWNIDRGYSLSPDRRRIALSALYGPTSADNATGLATHAIWTLAVDGTDFRRLTPTFPNTSAGRSGFSIDVSDPAWTADGKRVVYGYGEYWWEGTNFRGGSFPWIVSANGGSLPSSLPTSTDCTVIHPSRNPATGELLFLHSVCIPGQSESGLYLYPAAGGTSPRRLIGRATDGIDVFLATPSWLPDGSGFVFIGSSEGTGWASSVLLYDMSGGKVLLVTTPANGAPIWGAAISSDASKIVYCLVDKDTDARDLHLIDLAPATPTDVAITHDGKSCYPAF